MFNNILFILLFLIELVIFFVSSKGVTRSISLFFLSITKHQKITIGMIALLFLPGVIIHEFAHYIMAKVLLVHAGNMEFMPVVRNGHVKLGSVSIAKTDPIRRLLIGIAPVLSGMLLLYGFFLLYFSSFIGISFVLKQTILGYSVFTVGNTMFSSKRDMEGSVVLLLLLSIGAILLLFFHPLIGIQIFTFAVTFVKYFKQLDTIFFIAIIINVSIYAGVKLVLKKTSRFV